MNQNNPSTYVLLPWLIFRYSRQQRSIFAKILHDMSKRKYFIWFLSIILHDFQIIICIHAWIYRIKIESDLVNLFKLMQIFQSVFQMIFSEFQIIQRLVQKLYYNQGKRFIPKILYFRLRTISPSFSYDLDSNYSIIFIPLKLVSEMHFNLMLIIVRRYLLYIVLVIKFIMIKIYLLCLCSQIFSLIL